MAEEADTRGLLLELFKQLQVNSNDEACEVRLGDLQKVLSILSDGALSGVEHACMQEFRSERSDDLIDVELFLDWLFRPRGGTNGPHSASADLAAQLASAITRRLAHAAMSFREVREAPAAGEGAEAPEAKEDVPDEFRLISTSVQAEATSSARPMVGTVGTQSNMRTYTPREIGDLLTKLLEAVLLWRPEAPLDFLQRRLRAEPQAQPDAAAPGSSVSTCRRYAAHHKLQERLAGIGCRAATRQVRSLEGFVHGHLALGALALEPLDVADKAELASTLNKFGQEAAARQLDQLLEEVQAGACQLALADQGTDLRRVVFEVKAQISRGESVLIETHQLTAAGELRARWDVATVSLPPDELPLEGALRGLRGELGEHGAGLELKPQVLAVEQETGPSQALPGLSATRVVYHVKCEGSGLPAGDFVTAELVDGGRASTSHFWQWRSRAKWEAGRRRRVEAMKRERAPARSFTTKINSLETKVTPKTPMDKLEREHAHEVLRKLYPNCERVEYMKLHGGFSGSVVLRITSRTQDGQDEHPTVVKIDDKEEIEKENKCFQLLASYLGENATRVLGVESVKEVGGMKIEFAGACWLLPELAGSDQAVQLLTFKELFMQEMEAGNRDLNKDAVITSQASSVAVIDELFGDILIRAVSAPRAVEAGEGTEAKMVNLVDFLKIGEDIRENFHGEFPEREQAKVAGMRSFFEGQETLLSELQALFADFAQLLQTGPRSEYLNVDTHQFGIVHGDLHGMNILLDSEGTTWVVDFGKTGWKHPLTDLAKFEITLILEYTPLKLTCGMLKGQGEKNVAGWLGVSVPVAEWLAKRLEHVQSKEQLLGEVAASEELAAHVDSLEMLMQRLDLRIAVSEAEHQQCLEDAAAVVHALANVDSLDRPLPSPEDLALQQEGMLMLWATLQRVRAFSLTYFKKLEGRDSPAQYLLLLFHFSVKMVSYGQIHLQQRHWALAYARLLAEALMRHVGHEARVPEARSPVRGGAIGSCIYPLARQNDGKVRGELRRHESASSLCRFGEAEYDMQVLKWARHVRTRFSSIIDPISQETISVLDQCVRLRFIQGSRRQELMERALEMDQEMDNEIMVNRLGLALASAAPAEAGDRGSSSSGAGKRSQLISDELYGDGTRNIVLLGAAASGKTTLLQKILVEGVTFRKQGDDAYVPLFVRVVEICRMIERRGWDEPAELLDLYLQERFGADSLRYRLFSHLVQSGKLLLLLDGLDEAGGRSELRKMLERWIAEGIVPMKPPIRLLVSSRHSGFREDVFGGFKFAQLLPLSTANRQEIAEKRLGPEHAKRFMQEISKPAWEDMGRNILMLSLLIHAFKTGEADTLPANRTELYKVALQLMLGFTDRRKFAMRQGKLNEAQVDNIAKLTQEHMVEFIQELFLHAHRQERRDFTEEEVVQLDREKDITTASDYMQLWESLRHGILEGRVPLIMCVSEDVSANARRGGVSKFRAPHLTYQEYLSASCLARHAKLNVVEVTLTRSQLERALADWAGANPTVRAEEGGCWLLLAAPVPLGDRPASPAAHASAGADALPAGEYLVERAAEAGKEEGWHRPLRAGSGPGVTEWLPGPGAGDGKYVVGLRDSRSVLTKKVLPNVHNAWWLQVTLMLGGCLEWEDLRILASLLLDHDDLSCSKCSLLLKILDERGVALHKEPASSLLWATASAVRQRRSLEKLCYCLTHVAEEMRFQALMEVRKFGIDTAQVLRELVRAFPEKPPAVQVATVQSMAGVAGFVEGPLDAATHELLLDFLVSTALRTRATQPFAEQIILRLGLAGSEAVREFLLQPMRPGVSGRDPMAAKRSLQRIVRLRVSSEDVLLRAAELFCADIERGPSLAALKSAPSLPESVRRVLLDGLSARGGDDQAVVDLLTSAGDSGGLHDLMRRLASAGDAAQERAAAGLASRLFCAFASDASCQVLAQAARSEDAAARCAGLAALMQHCRGGNAAAQRCVELVADLDLPALLREAVSDAAAHAGDAPGEECAELLLARMVMRVGSVAERQQLVAALADLIVAEEAPETQRRAVELVTQLGICDPIIFSRLVRVIKADLPPRVMNAALRCIGALYLQDGTAAKELAEALPAVLKRGARERRHEDEGLESELTEAMESALSLILMGGALRYSSDMRGACEQLLEGSRMNKVRMAAMNVFLMHEQTSRAELLPLEIIEEGQRNVEAVTRNDLNACTYSALQAALRHVSQDNVVAMGPITAALSTRLSAPGDPSSPRWALPHEVSKIMEQLCFWQGACVHHFRDVIWSHCKGESPDPKAAATALKLIATFPEHLVFGENREVLQRLVARAKNVHPSDAPGSQQAEIRDVASQALRLLANSGHVELQRAAVEEISKAVGSQSSRITELRAAMQTGPEELEELRAALEQTSEGDACTEKGWTVVETEHPYTKSTLENVCLPEGTRRALVVFSRRCVLDEGDTLQVTGDGASQELRGAAPWDPLVVDLSEESTVALNLCWGNSWGYAALVAPLSDGQETESLVQEMERLLAERDEQAEACASRKDALRAAEARHRERSEEFTNAIVSSSSLLGRLLDPFMSLATGQYRIEGVQGLISEYWGLLEAAWGAVSSLPETEKATKISKASRELLQVVLGALVGVYTAEHADFLLDVELPEGARALSLELLEWGHRTSEGEVQLAAFQLWLRVGAKAASSLASVIGLISTLGGDDVSRSFRSIRLRPEELREVVAALEDPALSAYAFQALVLHFRQCRSRDPRWSPAKPELALLGGLMEGGSMEAMFLLRELNVGIFEDAMDLSFLNTGEGSLVVSMGKGGMNGHGTDQVLPKVLPLVGRLPVAKLAVGAHSTILLTESGDVYHWGSPETEIPGLKRTPQRVLGLPIASDVAATRSNASHPQYCAFAAIADGKLFTWGRGESGQLLHGKDSATTFGAPKEVEFFSGQQVVNVALGGQVTLVSTEELDESGATKERRVYIGGTFGSGLVFGRNNGEDCRTEHTPLEVEALRGKRIVQLMCMTEDEHGNATAYALEATGDLYSWLSGWHPPWNHLGHGNGIDTRLTEPKVVEVLRGQCASIVGTPGIVGATTTSGRLFMWGNRLGLGSDGGDTAVPREVTRLSGARITSVSHGSSTGGISAGACTSDGDMYFWGSNDDNCGAVAGKDGFPEKYILQGVPEGYSARFVEVNANHAVLVLHRAAADRKGKERQAAAAGS